MKSSRLSDFTRVRKLHGELWGVTSFFNPAGYETKLKNYRRFRESSRRQGLRLAAVELAFGDRPFELGKDDAEILVQIRGKEKNVMWQKERLLNEAIDRLPATCDKVVWLDCDIVFENDRWVDDVADALERFAMVQPFQWVVRLPKGARPDGLQGSLLPIADNGAVGGERVARQRSALYQWAESDVLRLENGGFAMAARRSVLGDRKLYDGFVIGGGDMLPLLAAFSGDVERLPLIVRDMSDGMRKDIVGWAENFHASVRGSASYVPGTVFHLWHGNHDDRNYVTRFVLYDRFDFDPSKDVRRDVNGCWRWSSDKPELHAAVASYFHARGEDGNRVAGAKADDFKKALAGDAPSRPVAKVVVSRTSKALRLLRKLSRKWYFRAFVVFAVTAPVAIVLAGRLLGIEYALGVLALEVAFVAGGFAVLYTRVQNRLDEVVWRVGFQVENARMNDHLLATQEVQSSMNALLAAMEAVIAETRKGRDQRS